MRVTRCPSQENVGPQPVSKPCFGREYRQRRLPGGRQLRRWRAQRHGDRRKWWWSLGRCRPARLRRRPQRGTCAWDLLWVHVVKLIFLPVPCESMWVGLCSRCALTWLDLLPRHVVGNTAFCTLPSFISELVIIGRNIDLCCSSPFLALPAKVYLNSRNTLPPSNI